MRRYLGPMLVVSLVCVLAGCQKAPQQPSSAGSGSKNQVAVGQQAAENVEHGEQVAIVQPASENADQAALEQPSEENANKSGEEAKVPTWVNPVPNADGQMVCGPTMLAPEDADKWDCVPDIGYWCTAPGGCPVNGNIAMAGTRLVYALPVPQGSGFRFEHPLQVPDRVGNDPWSSSNLRWSCASEDGCPCGSGRVAKWGECFGDTYLASDSDGKCQDKVCGGFCKNGQCVCGNEGIAENAGASLKCQESVMFCMDEKGCTHEGKKFAQHEGWIDFELKCEDEKGCACGSAKCSQYDKCIPSKNKCIKPPGAKEAPGIPEGYTRRYYSDDELECIKEEGCACGSVVCPKEFVCRNDVCFRVDTSDNGEEYSFYCNQAKGCSCGISVCPKGAFCHDVKYHDGTGWEVSCVKFDRQFKNESEAIQYMDSSEFFSSFVYAFDEEDMEILKKKIVLYEEHNDRGKIFRNGKLVEQEFHAEPGRVCGGKPLEKGYLCYESHVLFDRKDNVTPWQTCDESPYINIDDQCVIADEVFEQICNDKKGCNCGTEKIVNGDICVDGHAQCSTKKPRPGCLCGDSKLEDGFVCYKGQQVCQGVMKKDSNEDEDEDTEKTVDTSCACNGQTIHLGDICLKDKVICGADATETPGCLCGGKALREGYRCFLEKQLCACNGEDEEACTCKCGEQDIQKDAECGKDDVPVIPKGAKIKENADGSYTLNCDGNEVRLKDPDCGSMHVGEYRLRLEDPEDQRLLCTCGTGKPVPGKGYGCGFTPGTVGYGSEFMQIAEPDGYQCQDFNGCKCGLETCNPGDICRVENGESPKCEKFLTFDGECAGHVLPATKVSAWGYGCYRDHEPAKPAEGWYCMNGDGCACGDVTCAQWQLCLTPGICSKNKLPENKHEFVMKPVIEVCESF